MKAKILDIDDSKLVIKTEQGRFITISRERVKFDCYIGQNVIAEKNGSRMYILPDESSFIDDGKRKSKCVKIEHKRRRYKKQNKKIVIFLVIMLLCIVIAIPVSIIIISDLKEQERVAKLDECINQAIFDTEYLKEQFSKKIECYKSYGGVDANSLIDENEQKLKEVLANECWLRAIDDYKVSNEEWENASNDINGSILLQKRVKNGYEAQKSCYKDINGYDTSKFDVGIKEAQSKIEYLEGLLQSQRNNYSSGRQSFNCTTNTVGNYTYTNCF